MEMENYHVLYHLCFYINYTVCTVYADELYI